MTGINFNDLPSDIKNLIFNKNREYNNNINRQHRLHYKESFNCVICDINFKFDYENNWGGSDNKIISTPSEVLHKIKYHKEQVNINYSFEDSDEE